jgi:UDP-N-acetylglucosamine--dolichyl-phosphate N-acetylglucosaminephosphotransferase
MGIVYLVASAVASFVATFLFVPWLIRNLRGTSAVGRDINKPGRPKVPEMGGLAVIVGSCVGITLLVVFSPSETSRVYYYAALTASLGAGVVGVMDDAFNLRKRTKAIAPFFLALPLGVASVASGNTILFGVSIGYLIVPVVAAGVTSAANAANMLEGLNGLGAGLMVTISLALISLSILVGSTEGLFLLFPLVGALIAFLWYNRYPARVFPGDSMTLFSGAAIASAAIVSSPSLKTFGAVLFLPMVIEFFLKARGKFRAENYGTPDREGKLHYRGRVESLTHLIMKKRPMREWRIVLLLWCVQAMIGVALVLKVSFWG